mgnify:CR=1 FL=1
MKLWLYLCSVAFMFYYYWCIIKPSWYFSSYSIINITITLPITHNHHTNNNLSLHFLRLLLPLLLSLLLNRYFAITSIPNPMDPTIYITGLDKCSRIFKSKMLPGTYVRAVYVYRDMQFFFYTGVSVRSCFMWSGALESLLAMLFFFLSFPSVTLTITKLIKLIITDWPYQLHCHVQS